MDDQTKTTVKIAAAGCVIVLVAILIILAVAPGVRQAPTPPDESVARFELYYNETTGFSLNSTGPFVRPGPTLTANATQPFSITFYAADNVTHLIFIDYTDDGIWNMAFEPAVIFSKGNPAVLQIKFLPGTYPYRDIILPFDNGGSIVVTTPPRPWFQWNPFFLFGLMAEIAIAGFGIFIVVQAVRWGLTRRKLKNNPDIVKWVAATMDPDAPTRLTVEKVRKGKWKKPEKSEEDGNRM